MSTSAVAQSSVDSRTLALESLRIEALDSARLAVIGAAFTNACLFQLALTAHTPFLRPILALCAAMTVGCVANMAVASLRAWFVLQHRAGLAAVQARVQLARERQAEGDAGAWLKARVVEVSLLYFLLEFAATPVGVSPLKVAVIATIGIAGCLLRLHFRRKHEATAQLAERIRSWDQEAKAAALPLLA